MRCISGGTHPCLPCPTVPWDNCTEFFWIFLLSVVPSFWMDWLPSSLLPTRCCPVLSARPVTLLTYSVLSSFCQHFYFHHILSSQKLFLWFFSSGIALFVCFRNLVSLRMFSSSFFFASFSYSLHFSSELFLLVECLLILHNNHHYLLIYPDPLTVCTCRLCAHVQVGFAAVILGRWCSQKGNGAGPCQLTENPWALLCL